MNSVSKSPDYGDAGANYGIETVDRVTGQASQGQPANSPASSPHEQAGETNLNQLVQDMEPGTSAAGGINANRVFEAPSQVAPQINIYGTAEFHSQANNALDKIKQAPSGRKMIDDLSGPARKGNTVTIQSGLKSATYAHLNPAQRQRYPAMDYKQQSDKATQLAQKKMLGIKGEGANAEILWAPKQALQLNPDGQPTGIKDDDNEQESHLVLAHELVHARRLVKGTSTAGSSSRYDPKSPAGKEEQRAVGIGKPSNLTRPSENSVRQELGFPLRTAYQKVDSESERAPSPPLQFGAQETNNNRNSDIDSDS